MDFGVTGCISKIDIQYFDTFTEGFMNIGVKTLKELIKYENTLGSDGIITRTYDDENDKIYFLMTDKYGHTTIYRMDEEEFLFQRAKDRKDAHNKWLEGKK